LNSDSEDTDVCPTLPWPNPLTLHHNATKEQLAFFTGTFREVWDRVDPGDREVLLRHWGPPHWTPDPSIILEPAGSFQKEQGESPACATHLGRRIRVEIGWLCNLLNPAWARLVIAEELAHCFLFATHRPSHTALPPDGEAALKAWRQAQEADAQEVVKRWDATLASHLPEFSEWLGKYMGDGAGERQ
jgi:hypothetical protein